MDADYVADNPQLNLHLWSLNDIAYMEQLAASVGPIARQQLYAVILAGKRHSKLERSCPGLKTRLGTRTAYSFLINAKELADYVYVHHRQLSGVSEASQAYQRMLRPQKLKQIRDYVDTDDGFFANNIILNFTRQLQWTRMKAEEDGLEIGTVKLPGFYGCAWIVDGQHRLYGAAAAQKDVLLPVIALENLRETEQASLFVEINKKQTAVAGNLLWDLYSDIYRGSDEPREARFWLISEIARRLGRDGPLRRMISFESDLSTREAPLTLTTVCTAIQQNCPWDLLAADGTSDDIARNITRLISSYFDALRQLRAEEWDSPGRHRIILTNNGFVVFMMLFGDMTRHFKYRGQEALFKPASVTRLASEMKTLLQPAVQYISEEQPMAHRIVRGTGHAPQMGNALELVKWIHGFFPDFCPPRLSASVPDLSDKMLLPAESLIKDRATKFEAILRRYVLDRLIEWHGQGWWKHGLPGNLKADLDKRWQKALVASPELRQQKEPNRTKFNYSSLGQVADVILYGENWDKGRFESIFPSDKNNVRRRIIEVAAARDAKSHTRDGTPQELLEAASSLRWFSMCMADTSLNPYTENIGNDGLCSA